MTKVDAIRLLGGTVSTAAAAVGVTYQAVDKWPEVLPRRIEDRVLAVLARRHLPQGLLRPDLVIGDGTAHDASLGLATSSSNQNVEEAIR